MVGNDGRWDNPYWEYHLPVNPILDPDLAVLDGGDPAQHYVYRGPLVCDVGNWRYDTGVAFRPRLKEGIQYEEFVRRKYAGEAKDDDWDPALDEDSSDEYYDSAFQ